jgi:hypothetical protein
MSVSLPTPRTTSSAFAILSRTGGRLAALVIFLLYFSSLSIWAHESTHGASVKSIRAIRASPTAPKIDGVLDDEVWQHAPIASGFYQRDPEEGIPASEETAFQIAYDDEALYIAILCCDSEPDKIVKRLYRRDQIRYGETDWVGIRLDPHHDHQTGFGFAITPSGSFCDNVIIDDSGFDGTWDSVWEVRTGINDKGWNVELKIPYHALRFSPKEEYIWGINLDRKILRKQEYDMWQLVRKNESGISSRNGHIVGIKGIKPPAHLEFLPYTVARETLQTEENADRWQLFSTLGMDVRYGITSNISLNTTLNPDFGQVEADPAVLNLSVFETYYQERRPFFVEGAGIFSTPFQLLYSRRIGRQPGRFSLPEDSEEISRPESSTILGAAKITGKTQSKTSFGIMEAVTEPEYATIQRTVMDPDTGVEHVEEDEYLVEPLTNYFAGRVQQDFLGGNSTAGLLLTSVNRRDAESAYTGGFDWNLKWRKNTYGFSGQAAGSRTGETDDRKTGYATQLNLGKESGWFTAGLGFTAISPEFDANDLGFTYQADYLMARPWIGVRKNKEWGPFRSMLAEFLQKNTWNYDGVRRDNVWDLGTHAELMNYWSITAYLTHGFETLNDWKTRGGPLIVEPGWTAYYVDVTSDSRKMINGNIGCVWVPTEEVPQKEVWAGINFQPTSMLMLTLSPSYTWSRPIAQWVTNVDDDGDGVDDHFVFGELTNNTLNLTTRANVIFTPMLSLEFYMQAFVTVGEYDNFKELARPESYEFTSYPDIDLDPDFHNRSLRSNLVLRWEYSPGSTLFLVWAQSRGASDKDTGFRPLESLGHSFTDQGTNVFFAKLNYWLGI